MHSIKYLGELCMSRMKCAIELESDISRCEGGITEGERAPHNHPEYKLVNRAGRREVSARSKWPDGHLTFNETLGLILIPLFRTNYADVFHISFSGTVGNGSAKCKWLFTFLYDSPTTFLSWINHDASCSNVFRLMCSTVKRHLLATDFTWCSMESYINDLYNCTYALAYLRILSEQSYILKNI